ncbi:hypothetical protein [Acetobacter sp.]|uniref:hypothetical protein n=1 Tax=Acetobacter sp. TaxID=440 RepID=UPI0039E7DBD2
MVHYVNTNGVTCVITDHQGFLGVRDGYHVAMTGPDGARIYAGVIHPAIFGGQGNGNVFLGTCWQPGAVPAPAGGTYIVPPGVYATFGIAPATGHAPSGSAFYIGGNALLGVALGAPAGLRVCVGGGYAMFGAPEPNATLDGAELSIAYGGVFSCGAVCSPAGRGWPTCCAGLRCVLGLEAVLWWSMRIMHRLTCLGPRSWITTPSRP